MEQQITTNLDAWKFLVSMGLPFIAATLNRVSWPSTYKLGGFVVVTAIAAAIEVYLRNQWSLENWAVSLVLLVTIASGFYQLFKPAVKDIEEITG